MSISLQMPENVSKRFSLIFLLHNIKISFIKLYDYYIDMGWFLLINVSKSTYIAYVTDYMLNGWSVYENFSYCFQIRNESINVCIFVILPIQKSRAGKYCTQNPSKKLGKKRWKTGNKDLNVSYRKRSVLLESLQLNELLLLDDIDDRVYEHTF